MSEKNRFAYPFYIVAGTLGCLLALSCVQNSFSLKNFTSRQVDLLADLRPKNTPGLLPGEDSAATVAGTTTQPTSPADSTQAVDTTATAAAPRYNFETYTGIQDYGKTSTTPGDISPGMAHFLQALHDLKAGKRRKVRIAYFGDSMIEGDLITEDLRDSLQNFFGGEGVGFVPVTSIVASFRTTITHTFSKDWTDYHYKNLPAGNLPLGISGHTFLPSAGSWVKYSPVHKPHLDKFEEVNLIYGPGDGHSTLTANEHTYPLSGNQTVNSLAIQPDTTGGLLMKFDNAGSQPLYGVSFESPEGVFVDNFSFRGISGIELGRLSRDMLMHLQEERPYDLIVLQYGANILWKPELTDYSWYQRPMTKVLDSLRADFPQTSFLVISTADKSYRKEDKYVTAPGVTALLRVQHTMAEAHEAAFWNLYANMGGNGSMTQWVESEHPLANKDYTHFNRQGAAKVGALLFKALLNKYHEDEKP
ncbi:hypothetical protein DCM91_15170 [Chitinophaga costaii]|nr:hypothetical protein [Chitinophaga costaii]PUZ22066.1 hypothetical protein DCM91_15170 [Chitinophaga costaii]